MAITSPNPSSLRRPSGRSTPYTYLRITACRLPGGPASTRPASQQAGQHSSDVVCHVGAVGQVDRTNASRSVSGWSGRAITNNKDRPAEPSYRYRHSSTSLNLPATRLPSVPHMVARGWHLSTTSHCVLPGRPDCTNPLTSNQTSVPIRLVKSNSRLD